MSTEQQWLDSLTDADKDQLLVDAYFKKSIADTAAAKPVACPECGGGPVTWKCLCEPMWRPATPAPSVADAPIPYHSFEKCAEEAWQELAAPPAPSIADAAGAS